MEARNIVSLPTPVTLPATLVRTEGDRIVVDRRVAEHNHVVFDGGVHDTSLRMRADDLIEAAEAEVADIASD